MKPVICLNNDSLPLTVNKEYSVIEEKGNYLLIKCDDGEDRWLFNKRFKDVHN